MAKKQKIKSAGGKTVGNRTVIGVICIVAALVICFGVAPLVNKISDGTTKVVRVITPVLSGAQISEADVKIEEVGSKGLPEGVITKLEDVVGKYATCDLHAGDYVMPGKVSAEIDGTAKILTNLNGDEKVISVTIGSFAQGLSGKLQAGDIVSVLVYDAAEDKSTTPKELQYLKVITSTTSAGVDKENVTDNAQPVTVTLLVNQKQAELLAKYEKTSTMHFTLEYRGDPEMAQNYLNTQADYFKKAGK